MSEALRDRFSNTRKSVNRDQKISLVAWIAAAGCLLLLTTAVSWFLSFVTSLPGLDGGALQYPSEQDKFDLWLANLIFWLGFVGSLVMMVWGIWSSTRKQAP